MIDYLEQLVDDGQYGKALQVGEQLLRSRDNTGKTLIAIYCNLLRAQCFLGQLEKARNTGQVCMSLAQDLGEWDYYGTACIFLGVVHTRVHEHETAVSLFRGYLNHLSYYAWAGKHEVMARYNLGLTYLALRQEENAATALGEALVKASVIGRARDSHGIRQALIHAKLSIGDMRNIPRLLVQCGHYLRQNPEEYMYRQSHLIHMELRARFAFQTDRLLRTSLIAVRGLQVGEGDSQYGALFHLLIARVSERLGRGVEALGHALAAEICAQVGGRPDLEVEATSLTLRLIRAFPETANEEMDRFYLVTTSGGGEGAL